MSLENPATADREEQERRRGLRGWLWGQAGFAVVETLLLWSVLSPIFGTRTGWLVLVVLLMATVGSCWIRASWILFIWRTRLPEWLFPLRGRWVRHLLSGVSVMFFSPGLPLFAHWVWRLLW